MDLLITWGILLALAWSAWAGYQRYQSASETLAAKPALAVQYPEHGPVGVLLVCVMACISFLPLAAGINSVIRNEGRAEGFFDFPGLAFLATVLGVGITYHFYRFHCWAWFFVAGWLAPGTLPVLALFDRSCCWQEGERELLIAIGAVCFVPLHYLWKRRYDFWVEGQAVRRAIDFQQNGHRWVRHSWRDDARLLKMRMAERDIAARTGVGEALRGAGRAG